MPRQLLLFTTIILGLLTAFQILAGDDSDGHRGTDQRAFVGLWQGLDSNDGSTQYLSITCSRDKTCDVRLTDTAFTLSCPNQMGFAQGIGTTEGLVLKVELTLTCKDPFGTSVRIGSQANEFVLDRSNGTLTNINDDPIPFHNVFHLISKK